MLASGPSLSYTWTDDAASKYETIIALNASVSHPCARSVDWWAFMDPPAVYWFRPSGTVRGVYCAGPTIIDLRSGSLAHLGFNRDMPAIEGPAVARRVFPHEMPLGYTITYAVGLCVHLGLADVDIYGCDMMGGDHFDGKHDPKSITKRWDIDDRPGQRAEIERMTGRAWGKGEKIDRWLREGAELNMAMRHAEKAGVSFRFVRPT